jgi:hypothetical protein
MNREYQPTDRLASFLGQANPLPQQHAGRHSPESNSAPLTTPSPETASQLMA